ncbi:poly(ADP-ribose) polymerase family protein [Pelolinea submarina]|uniref:Uncharacterized protein n=1 Tax=Pelolinea submarina TaxID=913107 RepID=A0A3E0AIB8_9CHLR|nr:hypothetical protein [Pelolinea submarina]REG11418.1 hypothetical protein DFR64_1299 [Pelolinea submarina]
MFNFDKRNGIKITFDDIERFNCPDITITVEDVNRYIPPVDIISLDDFTEYERNIIKISFADLPADLNNAITDCYHGTSKEAAEKIVRSGFKVGCGSGMGSGIYFAVGAIGCSSAYKRGNGVILRAKVHWGNVFYLDDKNCPRELIGTGDGVVIRAKKLGYDSLIQSRKYSINNPTVGVVLAKKDTFIKPPQIEVIDIIEN